jgi:hypothetical protein
VTCCPECATNNPEIVEVYAPTGSYGIGRKLLSGDGR